MAVGDISNILSRLNKNGKNLYITQEVVYGAGQPVTPNQYTETGDVQEYVPRHYHSRFFSPEDLQIPLHRSPQSRVHRSKSALRPSRFG